MRLVRFLAAGKSLVGLKDIEGRYRLPRGRALPRFGTTGNAAASVKAESANPASRGGSGGTAAAGELRSGTVNEHAVLRPEPVSIPSQPEPAQALKVCRVGKVSIFRKLFGWLPWHREAHGTGAVPNFSSLPVQTELSLENVKVVRNDLSESDLEVQTVQKRKSESPFSKQLVGEQSSSGAMNLSLPRSGDRPGAANGERA